MQFSLGSRLVVMEVHDRNQFVRFRIADCVKRQCDEQISEPGQGVEPSATPTDCYGWLGVARRRKHLQSSRICPGNACPTAASKHERRSPVSIRGWSN